MSIHQCVQLLQSQCDQTYQEENADYGQDDIETTAGLEPFHVVARLASILWRPTTSAQLIEVMKRLHTHFPPEWKTK